MTEGEEAFIALSWTSFPPPRAWEEATRRQWQTTEFWRQWITVGEFPDHPWREALQRSALTLKGLTYAPTGALIAAPTTSLPETPGGERNWDYRYAWVRDSTFALWALYTLGLDREADDFFAFIRDVAAEDDLQIMYGIGGERDLPESIVEGLDGYDRARPVRVGNAAVHQRQHDVWGTMLDSVYLHAKSVTSSPSPSGPSCSARSSRPPLTGGTPITASGRSAAKRSTSPPPSSCAGSPWTAVPGWRGCTAKPITPGSGT
jgi:GH15 family glucan-1,4-alpha-glucosidase